jgi:hypothetical protein
LVAKLKPNDIWDMDKKIELESYHLVWLADHPNRTVEWLRRMMADGFHIHHIDGDHSNDNPMNLVLIEGADHLMLHNGKKRPVTVLGTKPKLPRTESLRRKQERIARKRLYTVPGQEKTVTRTELLRLAVERANNLK